MWRKPIVQHLKEYSCNEVQLYPNSEIEVKSPNEDGYEKSIFICTLWWIAPIEKYLFNVLFNVTLITRDRHFFQIQILILLLKTNTSQKFIRTPLHGIRPG